MYNIIDNANFPLGQVIRSWYHPANEVSAALLELLIDMYAVGSMILIVIVGVLCVILDRFVVDDNRDHWDLFEAIRVAMWGMWEPNASYGMRSRQYVDMPEDAQRIYPTYFSSRQEAALDVTFLLLPTAAVAMLLFPTLGFLYNQEFILSTNSYYCSIDVTGHQWYWTYAYTFADESSRTGVTELVFDSYMDINANGNYYLEVDNRLLIPQKYNMLLCVTSDDVIHSFAVPQLGIKVDAVPGRFAYANLRGTRNGVFYGQCSELCGVNHGFMPIAVEVVDESAFVGFILMMKGTLVSVLDSLLAIGCDGTDMPQPEDLSVLVDDEDDFEDECEKLCKALPECLGRAGFYYETDGAIELAMTELNKHTLGEHCIYETPSISNKEGRCCELGARNCIDRSFVATATECGWLCAHATIWGLVMRAVCTSTG